MKLWVSFLVLCMAMASQCTPTLDSGQARTQVEDNDGSQHQAETLETELLDDYKILSACVSNMPYTIITRNGDIDQDQAMTLLANLYAENGDISQGLSAFISNITHGLLRDGQGQDRPPLADLFARTGLAPEELSAIENWLETKVGTDAQSQPQTPPHRQRREAITDTVIMCKLMKMAIGWAVSQALWAAVMG